MICSFSLFRQRKRNQKEFFSQPPRPFDLRSNSLTLGIAFASKSLPSLNRDFPCLRRGLIPPHAPPILGRGCNRSSRRSFIKVSSTHQRVGLIIYAGSACFSKL